MIQMKHKFLFYNFQKEHHSNSKKSFNQTFTCKLPGKKNIELTEV